MGLFGLINYENYLLHSLITSSYARNGLMIILTYLITGLVRFHISAALCMLLSRGNWVDYISPIIITVLLSLASNNIYRYVRTHKKFYKKLIDCIITNYSMANFILYKRRVLMVLGIYIMVVLCLMEINNQFIIITLVQTAISFGICDLLENDIPQAFIKRILGRWKHEPTMEEFAMIDGFYFPPKTLQNIRNVSTTKIIPITPEDVPEKPNTPPKINRIRRSTDQSYKIIPLIPLIHEGIPEKPPTPPSINQRQHNINN
jgi:hypothetical protein